MTTCHRNGRTQLRPLLSLITSPLSPPPSPLDINAWGKLLRRYPGDLAQLCCGILIYGCSLDDLQEDLAISRVQEYLEPAIVSPLGLVPKHDGGWRRIHGLSWPESKSVNDGIASTVSAISYMTVDIILDAVRRCGHGCFLVKRDIKDAFRIVPIAQSQRPLLAFTWENKSYLECCLPFGLSTAPFLFDLFSEGIHWLLLALFSAISFTIELFHYLDDFIAIIPHEGRPLTAVITTFVLSSNRSRTPLVSRGTIPNMLPAAVLPSSASRSTLSFFKPVCQEGNSPAPKLRRPRSWRRGDLVVETSSQLLASSNTAPRLFA
ncbi:hypothetical protein RJ55_08682 [Drechmeria coniospora]|nr:hypothetical protein RJ55_08682 [Drechmeria coniospora]